MRYYSNGKLLLSGEYLVLDGATSLALPTKFGQDLEINPIKEKQLVWGSFDVDGNCWFEAVFDLPKLRLVNCTFNSDKEGSAEFIAETLQGFLQEARSLNPDFLQQEHGFVVKTNLTFPKNWGLGSSSTLINNIATWANVDPYKLLWNAFSGSGYDIACAKHNSPILYTVNNKVPEIKEVSFNPVFKEQLFFVYLNQKQNSREGIAEYRKNINKLTSEITTVSNLSASFLEATSLIDFEKLITEHEKVISSVVKIKTVKEQLFSNYFGEVKSLGAWGGDFVLATGNADSVSYFTKKGYTTVLPYKKMIL